MGLDAFEKRVFFGFRTLTVECDNYRDPKRASG